MGSNGSPLDFESFLGNAPVDIDPYAFIKNSTSTWTSVPLSRFVSVLLLVFFCLHIIIAGICMIMLILPYTRGGKQSKWFFRRLYIHDESDREAPVHKAPLYFANARVLLTISQLLSSASTPAFIWFDNSLLTPSQQSLRPHVMPAFGLMNLAEILAYWSLSHCFLVTIYYGAKDRRESCQGLLSRCAPHWLINFLFFCIPIAATVMTIVVVTRVSSVTNQVQSCLNQFFAELDRGSILWAHVKANPQSPMERAQLIETNLEMKKWAAETGLQMVSSFDRFRFGEIVFLSFTLVNGPVFVILFLVLLRHYRYQRRSALTRLESTANSESGKQSNCVTTNMGYFDTLKKDRQFFHLNIRALATCIAMLVNIVVHIIAITRTVDTLSQPYWRGVVSCLATAGNTISGIPIAWQCWRLYADYQARPTAEPITKSASSPEKTSRTDLLPEACTREVGSEIHICYSQQEVVLNLQSGEPFPNCCGTSEKAG